MAAQTIGDGVTLDLGRVMLARRYLKVPIYLGLADPPSVRW
jgi:hypothetical protein